MDNQRGQTVLEYVLVAALFMMALVIAFSESNMDSAVNASAQNMQEHMIAE